MDRNKVRGVYSKKITGQTLFFAYENFSEEETPFTSVLNNTVFSNNNSTAVYVVAVVGAQHLTLVNCTIENNTGNLAGGIWSSSPPYLQAQLLSDGSVLRNNFCSLSSNHNCNYRCNTEEDCSICYDWEQCEVLRGFVSYEDGKDTECIGGLEICVNGTIKFDVNSIPYCSCNPTLQDIDGNGLCSLNPWFSGWRLVVVILLLLFVALAICVAAAWWLKRHQRMLIFAAGYSPLRDVTI